MEVAMMEEKIGTAAGAIWEALNSHGGSTLSKLKKQVEGKGPVFDWAIGWLAREDKIAIVPSKRSFLVRLKDSHGCTAGAP
jgi:hypothetical protein